jgi:hypothetical protein
MLPELLMPARTALVAMLYWLALVGSASALTEPRPPYVRFDVQAGAPAFDAVHDGPRGRLYVSIPDLKQVQVFSTSTFEVVDRYYFRAGPKGMALSIDGTRLFAALSGIGAIGVVDLGSRGVTEIDVRDALGEGGTYDVVEARTDWLFVTAEAEELGRSTRLVLVRLDLGNEVREIASGLNFSPRLQASLDRRFLYALKLAPSRQIWKFDLSDPAVPVESISPSLTNAWDFLLSPDGSLMFLGDSLRDGKVLRTDDWSEVATGVPSFPALSPSGDRIYGLTSWFGGGIASYDVPRLFIRDDEFIAISCPFTATGVIPVTAMVVIPVRTWIALGADLCVFGADLDGDGVRNELDACPRVAEPAQTDGDGDGDGDACDRCPAVPDSAQPDADADGAGDACDLFPEHALGVRPIAPAFARSDQDARLVYELVDRRDGRRIEELRGVRVRLTLGGSATFSDVASEGLLIEGGGTASALVEFVDGRVALDVRAASVGSVSLGLEDSQGLGVKLLAGIHETFESGDGGFTQSGRHAEWELGTPDWGPRHAHSGVRAWSVDLSGRYYPDGHARILSPAAYLPPEGSPELQVRSHFRGMYDSFGQVEITADSGRTWTALGKLPQGRSGYQLLSFGLGAFSGATVQIRFSLKNSSSSGTPGWIIDDFVLSGIGASVQFVDPDVDADADGLSNSAELERATIPLSLDSDADGLGDASDNCPIVANRTQSDTARPNGIGDACEDSDGDSVSDQRDACPLSSNADQSDTDADGLGDACDPYPDAALLLRPIQAFAVTGSSSAMTWELVDRRDGRRMEELLGVRITLTVDGSASFDTTASRGRLVEGGGTRRVLVEFVDGLVTIGLRDPVAEVVHLGAEDTEKIGIEITRDVFEDFEDGDGGFEHFGIRQVELALKNDAWQYGTPSVGPGLAFSGSKLWSTNLDGYGSGGGDSRLLSPAFRLPPVTRPVLEFASWINTSPPGSVEIVHEEETSFPGELLDTLDGNTTGYSLESYDLSAHAGEVIRVRFRHPGSLASQGWYLDDFALRGLSSQIDFLPAGADTDIDGLGNEAELEAGTHPRRPDTDGDTVLDGGDNCPLLVNTDQRDGVHPGGPGDACADPDGDGVPDLADNCADFPNLDQVNADGDIPGDACDPFPDVVLQIRPVSPPFALPGEPVSVTYRLEDRASGRLLDELTGARVTLTLDGSAVFGTTALAGRLLHGGGTTEALIEFVDGLVTLTVEGHAPGSILLDALDSERIDVVVRGSVFEDFEADDGGFTHAGSHDYWEYDTTSPPGTAFSGIGSWAMGNEANHVSTARLVSPRYRIPPSSRPVLEFMSQFFTPFDDAIVEVSIDGGAAWTTIASYSESSGGYQRKSYDLAAFEGKEIRLAFRSDLAGCCYSFKWRLDDLSLRWSGGAIEFLDPAADDDGDGLRNSVELTQGSDPRRPDTDGDGIADGADLCSSTSNPDQADSVHPGGHGDACEDPDADGIADQADSCPDTPNPDQSNQDGDEHGDACDSYPDAALRVRPVPDEFALTNETSTITYRLEDRRDGRLLDQLQGVRVTLLLDGSGVFERIAGQGRLLSGVGTGRALVEFVSALVTLEVADPAPERLQLGAEDSEEIGIVLGGDLFANFERSDGWFTHSGSNDPWEYGRPASGPGRASSGERVWATRLTGNYPENAEGRLISPPIWIPRNSSARLEFMSWLSASGDSASVQISFNGGTTWSFLQSVADSADAFTRVSLDLSDLSGDIRLGFRFSSDQYGRAPGWFVDDVSVSGGVSSIDFLDPALDEDQDGLDNSAELALGTGPRVFDTDFDSHRDGADNCPLVRNSGQFDRVHPNGVGDECDDPDRDGVFDATDNCADAPNADQSDRIHPNGKGDACDDPDGDGTADAQDNCLQVSNPDQDDRDADTVGDACDLCAAMANPEQSEAVACVALQPVDDSRCLRANVDLFGHGSAGEVQVYRLDFAAPETIRFEALVGLCPPSLDSLRIELNGSSVADLALESGQLCACPTPLSAVEVSDAELLRSHWKSEGGNELRIIKPGQGALLWVRMRISGDGLSHEECLFDASGLGCRQTPCTLSSTGAVDRSVASGAFLAHREPARTLSYSSPSLPGSIDLGRASGGSGEICVTGRLEPSLFGSTSAGDLLVIDPASGRSRRLGWLKPNTGEIEYDETSGRLFDATGARFSLPHGEALGGASFPAGISALEFVGTTLYATSAASPIAPSDLRIVSTESGQAVSVGSTGIRGPLGGLAYDLASGLMYGVDGSIFSAISSLYRIDLATGAATRIGSTGIRGAQSLEFGPDGNLYAGSGSFEPPRLYRIDLASGQGTPTAWSGASTVVALTLARSVPAADCALFDAESQRGLALNDAPCVTIDVKPGDALNPIEPLVPGAIAVAVLGSQQLDVTGIDTESLLFGPYRARMARSSVAHVADVNGDGWSDLVSQYRTLQTGLTFQSDEACIEGEVRGGASFQTCDTVSPAPDPGGPPDSDADGVPDATDNCPWYASANYSDLDGNGIGNKCECGDQNGDGRVNVMDLIAISHAIFNPPIATPLCDTDLSETCDVSDLVGLQRAIFGSQARCTRYPWARP